MDYGEDSDQANTDNEAFDVSNPTFLSDPHPTYARLRETDPIHWPHIEQPISAALC